MNFSISTSSGVLKFDSLPLPALQPGDKLLYTYNLNHSDPFESTDEDVINVLNQFISIIPDGYAARLLTRMLIHTPDSLPRYSMLGETIFVTSKASVNALRTSLLTDFLNWSDTYSSDYLYNFQFALSVESRPTKTPNFLWKTDWIIQGRSIYNAKPGVVDLEVNNLIAQESISKGITQCLPIPNNFAYKNWFPSFDTSIEANLKIEEKIILALNQNGKLIDFEDIKPFLHLVNGYRHYLFFVESSKRGSHTVSIFIIHEDSTALARHYKDVLPFDRNIDNPYLKTSLFDRTDMTSQITYKIDYISGKIETLSRPVKTDGIVKKPLKKPLKSSYVHANHSSFKTNGGRSYSTLISDKPFIVPNDYLERPHPKLMTLDLETYVEQGQLCVYACGFYTYDQSYMFFKSDYEGQDILRIMLDVILDPKFDGYYIYAHNFARFDAAFLLTVLKDFGSPRITMNNDGVIVRLELTRESEPVRKSKLGRPPTKPIKTVFHFKDSYLLLPHSLRKLAITFESPVLKGELPHHLINVYNYTYYRAECLKYLDSDLKSLYSVLLKFYWIIMDNFDLSIFKSSTTTGLGYQIFLSEFYNPAKQPFERLRLDAYEYLQPAYQGGIVDVYIPYGKDLYYYDINSLYPHTMKMPLPTCNPVYVSGKIRLNEFFGILRVKVTSPNYMHIPILPIKYNDRLICPVGTWEGTYFSEELKEAAKAGYSFEILDGYRFDNTFPFNSYIDYFYSLKENSSGVMRAIAKLFLVCLYGKMGMKPSTHEIAYYTSEEAMWNDQTKVGIKPYIEFDDGSVFARFKPHPASSKKSLENVACAIAVTAYGRMVINRYKNLPNNACHYSDTDSIVLSRPLEKDVSSKLGDMKLEYRIKEAYHLNPKCYSHKLYDGSYVNKIKGINLTKNYEGKELFNMFEKIYNGNESAITLYQNKMYIDFNQGTIRNVKHSPYTLKLSENKRLFIKDVKGDFLGTKPITINNYVGNQYVKNVSLNEEEFI